MSLKVKVLGLAISVLRGIYAPMKLQKVRNKIVIISRQSDKRTMDIRLLEDYIASAHPEVECVALCKRLEGGNPVAYGVHILQQMWHMAQSRVILIDGYCIAASILHHRQGTKVVQMWHALAAIKKFGYQTIDKPSGHSSQVAKVMCMHRNYDYVICPSEATGEYFKKCFNIEENQLIYMGLPRIDEILRPSIVIPEQFGLNESTGVDDFRNFVRETYEIDADREVVLYVPTFRKYADVDLEGIVHALNDEHFTLVVKAHPLYDNMKYGDVNLTAGDDEQFAGLKVQVIIDKTYTSYQWLSVCDRIITDYSALGVEAALLDKPLYYYVYDIDEYESNVGLNVNPMEELPQASADNADNLKRIVNDNYNFEELKKFKNKFISVDTNDCTAKLGDFLVNINDTE